MFFSKTHCVLIQACHEEAQHEAPNKWRIVGTGLIPVIVLELPVRVARLSGAAERTHTTRKRAIPKTLCRMMAPRRSRIPWLQKVKCIVATRRGCGAMRDSRLACNDAENQRCAEELSEHSRLHGPYMQFRRHKRAARSS